MDNSNTPVNVLLVSMALIVRMKSIGVIVTHVNSRGVTAPVLIWDLSVSVHRDMEVSFIAMRVRNAME